jgi:hypothetical protein
MQDYVNNWRETALILTTILFPAAGIWFIGKFLSVIPPSSLFSSFSYKEESMLTIHCHQCSTSTSFSQNNWLEGEVVGSRHIKWVYNLPIKKIVDN